MNFYLNWNRNYKRSKLKLSDLLNRKHAFNFDLSIPVPVEIEFHIVPHLKATLNAKMDP